MIAQYLPTKRDLELAMARNSTDNLRSMARLLEQDPSHDAIRATRGGRLMAVAFVLLDQRATDERADAAFRAIRSETMSRWGWRAR